MADSAPSLGSTDSAFDSRLIDFGEDGDHTLNRWLGWRLRVVVAAALLGCLMFFLLTRWLASTPHIDARWNPRSDGRVVLVASNAPELRDRIGSVLLAVRPVGGEWIDIDTAAWQQPMRWIVDAGVRTKSLLEQERLSAAFAAGSLELRFEDGARVSTTLHKRGSAALGSIFWLLGALALVLYLVAMVVLCSRPSIANVLYAIMAVCQASNLATIAIESTFEIGLSYPIPLIDLPLRMSLDLITAAAVATSVSLHPRRLRHAGWIGIVVFGFASAISVWQWKPVMALPRLDWLPDLSWYAGQGSMLLIGMVSIALLSRSHRLEPHPFTILLRRFGIVIVASLALLTVAIVITSSIPHVQRFVSVVGSTTWYVLLATLVLMMPFVAKSQQLMREFALLAAISTIATSLDLLFVAVFSIGQFASLTLSLFVALGAYAGVRQWAVNRLLGNRKLTTERMFEQLYRIAREAEVHPDLAPMLLSNLMRNIFEPLEWIVLPRAVTTARVFRSGSALIIPVPRLDIDADRRHLPPMSIVLRYAHRGRQLFTAEDARLADRIAEQLRRAVAFDKAVEQGRSEERARIAQDLHDDIGARLLTLMYKATSPDIEEYVRHTLKDLKTLTRGLAASHHPLSHAAAEWKADLAQRLTVAEIELTWESRFANDMILTVVQWSALTRILRELVSNTIAHSGARLVQIKLNLSQDDCFNLSVADDGSGRLPGGWNHGLGLSGVRKRVKQLGGDVTWMEASPRGIVCTVTLPKLAGT